MISLKKRIAKLPIIKEVLQRKFVLKKVKEARNYNKDLHSINIQNCILVVDRFQLLKKMPKSNIVAEIGVDEGDFSKSILTITNPKKLHLIDSWNSDLYPAGKQNIVVEKFKKEIGIDQVKINHGNSLSTLMQFDDNYFDWVYLDSGHGLQLTLNELAILKDKVKDDGIIAGHDYCRFTTDGRARMGVVEAVNHFCLIENYEFCYLTFETNRHLSFAIRRIKVY